MANFRKNHQRNSNPFTGLTLRVFILIVILSLLLLGANSFFQNLKTVMIEDSVSNATDQIERDYLPISDLDLEVVHHKYYSLGYNEQYEIPNWVAYIITRDELKIPNVKRYRDYIRDPSVSTQSAHYKDYSNSGYTRGHLAPAGDMAFNKTAMKESFYMSNITPQKKAFNNGIWKELEENVRDWAFSNERLYVVTGPLVKNIDLRIGRNDVGVPNSFYKAILDNSGSEKKTIGFIIPNEKSDQKLENYTVSIDKIEQETGLDLFSDLYTESSPELEASFDVKKWKWSNKKYKLRINKWNKE